MPRNREKAKSDKVHAIDRWVGYRWGLIVTRLGALAAREYVDQYQLTPSLWRVLAVVARFEPLSAASLSEHTRLDPPKVSRAIEVLVTRALLTRTKDPRDERRAILKLTRGGRALYARLEVAMSELEATLTATLTPLEVRTLWSAAAKIDIELARLKNSRP